ncbi:PTS transporter subunit EIIC, partial [Alkalihalophilus pseudofirmus]
VLYMSFNIFVSKILELFGTNFGVDFSQEVGNGLKMIGGVKTLDTGVLGAIVIAAIAIYLHNKFFDTKLPDFLGIFQGSALVA